MHGSGREAVQRESMPVLHMGPTTALSTYLSSSVTRRESTTIELVVRAVGDALRRYLNASDLVPDLESVCTLGTILACLQAMPPWTKMFPNGPKGGQEALRMPS